MSKKTDSWMPLWIGDYLADTQHLTRDEHGAYLLMLMAYWRNAGPLVDDNKRLAAITKATLKEWAELRPVLLEFFEVVDGHWHQKRMDAELSESVDRAEKAASKARKAAEARWGQSSDASSSNAPSSATSTARSNASSIPQALHEQCPSPSPITTPSLRSGVESASPHRGSRLSADWQLPDEWADWARQVRPDLNPTETANRFADYWHGMAGAKGRKADWLATWRNWVRNEKSPVRQAVTMPSSREARRAHQDAWMDELMGRTSETSGCVIDITDAQVVGGDA